MEKVKKIIVKYKKNMTNILKTTIVLAGEIIVGGLFSMTGMEEAHIFIIYVLGILITAMITGSRVCSVFSVFGIFIFYYLFSDPTFSFKSYSFGYPFTFLLLLISSVMMGTLARKNFQHNSELEKAACRNQVMLETSQLLQAAKCRQEIIEVTASRLIKILNKSLMVFMEENHKLTKPQIFFSGNDKSLSFEIDKKEMDAAFWAYNNNEASGICTENCQYARGTYLPIYTAEGNYGVIGIDFGRKGLLSYETNLIIGECALAFEREYYNRAREEAAVEAKNEKLRADLLKSISHDLRTPLTSISGNAALLSSQGELLTENKRNMLSNEILKDSTWLIDMVENLLSITKLGDMTKNIVMSPELLEDILEDSIEQAKKHNPKHNFKLEVYDDMQVVLCNARLISQVMGNLIGNAVKHADKGTYITVSTTSDDDKVKIQVIDEGTGVPNENKEHIFDMFYTTSENTADKGRGFGIGLALCKAIVAEHNGEITVEDNYPSGAIFTFTLKKARLNNSEKTKTSYS